MQIVPARRCVVVGVDGSPNSMAALQKAATEALARHARLDVIRVVRPVGPWAFMGTAAEWLRLRALVAGALPTTQHLTTRLRVVYGKPAPAILKAARNADLLVIGAREGSEHGRAFGGATVPAILSGAPCRVVVCEGSAAAGQEHR